MSDRYLIDSHKLIYHPRRVAQWLEGSDDWETAKSIYPIYLEVSPFGACNHRCTFCAVDYIGYQNLKLDHLLLKDKLSELASLGIKSIMFAGEGEPALYRELPEILDHCTAVGIDTSMTTNMVPFTTKNVDAFLRNCAWIKTSINAGTPETYSAIHRTKTSDFNRVLENFRLCVARRQEMNYRCTIGAQMILLPENAGEVTILGRILRDIGVDYLVVKPYSQHSFSVTRQYETIDYEQFKALGDELAAISTANFSVVFRKNTMQKLAEEERAYSRCLATPFFWAYIMADGSVYGCSAYLGESEFCYGNINEATFKEIWEGDRRHRNYLQVRRSLDIRGCRRNCRMDEINRYLWRLKNPDHHVNFI